MRRAPAIAIGMAAMSLFPASSFLQGNSQSSGESATLNGQISIAVSGGKELLPESATVYLMYLPPPR
jgi:hypothetical protein